MQVLCEDGNNQYQQTLKRKLVLEEEQIHRKLSDIKDKYDEMLRTVLRVGQQIEEK